MTPPDPFRGPGQPNAAAGRSAMAEYERLRQLVPRHNRWWDRRIVRSDLRAWTVLAIHGGRLPAGMHAADNVALVERTTLVDYITRRPYVLDPLAVAALAGATEAALPAAIAR